MTTEQIQFLEANKHYWTTYQRDKVVKHYDIQLRKELFKIARVFDPKANYCLHCSDDAVNMLKYVYTQYEKMEKKQEGNTQEEGVMKMTFPKEEVLMPEELEMSNRRLDGVERPTSDTNQNMEETENISFTKRRGRKPKTNNDEQY